MTEASTPNSRKSRLSRVYSVTCVAMALLALESSRFASLLRRLSGLSICKSTKPETRTRIAARGSTAIATPKSANTIRSDWSAPDKDAMTEVLAPLFRPRICWICPSRSVDWRAQLDRKKADTTRLRVAVSACVWTEVFIRVLEMLVMKKSPNDTHATVMAVEDVKETPMGVWILCVPWTPDTTTSETVNKRMAWLIAPITEMKVKARILERSELRSSHRMSEITETFGVLPVLDGPVVEKSFFTGPVSSQVGSKDRGARL